MKNMNATQASKNLILLPPKTFTLTVIKDGKIISKVTRECHTVNRNFWNAIMMSQSGVAGVVTNFGAGYISLKKTSAAVSAISENNALINTSGPVNDATRGIVVGTGVGAESYEGYALGTQVAHGSGAGQLLHAAHAAVGQAYVSGTLTWTLTIQRSFTNSSGGQIDINEIGMYAYIALAAYMIWRDLLGAATQIPNNSVLTVAYPLTLTLPA